MPASTFDHDAAVEAIYRTAAAPDLWPETITRIADHVGALGGLLAYAAPPGESNNLLVVGRLRDDLVDLYLQRYASNPFSRAMANVTPGKVVVAGQLTDMRAVRRSALYADILLPQAIVEQLAFSHAGLTRNGSSGGLAFMLDARRLDDASQATARIQRLVPHLTRALDVSLALGRHESGVWQLGQVLDAMPGAALLLDRAGAVLRMNAAAETLLQEADGLSLIQSDGFLLVAQAGEEARQLGRCIAQALAVTRGEDLGLAGPLRITRPSGRPPLIVLVTPLPPPAFTLFEAIDGGARALVQIVDTHRGAHAQAELLQHAVGLTAMESRVAALIGAGLSVPEAAATLGVTPNTVKTHLARCFDKAGVRSQAALARLLASLPTRGS
jgi:DNA-binding CsgD family transcriptional regulator